MCFEIGCCLQALGKRIETPWRPVKFTSRADSNHWRPNFTVVAKDWRRCCPWSKLNLKKQRGADSSLVFWVRTILKKELTQQDVTRNPNWNTLSMGHRGSRRTKRPLSSRMYHFKLPSQSHVSPSQLSVVAWPRNDCHRECRLSPLETRGACVDQSDTSSRVLDYY